MLRTIAMWASIALLWVLAVAFGITAVHLIRTDPGRPFNARERWVAFRFWFRRWTAEESGPVLCYGTIAAGIVAVALAFSMATG